MIIYVRYLASVLGTEWALHKCLLLLLLLIKLAQWILVMDREQNPLRLNKTKQNPDALIRIPSEVRSQPACFTRIPPGVFDTQHCLNTVNTLLSLQLQKLEERIVKLLAHDLRELISGRAKARVSISWLSGCGVPLPFLLPCETLQRKWLR